MITKEGFEHGWVVRDLYNARYYYYKEITFKDGLHLYQKDKSIGIQQTDFLLMPSENITHIKVHVIDNNTESDYIISYDDFTAHLTTKEHKPHGLQCFVPLNWWTIENTIVRE